MSAKSAERVQTPIAPGVHGITRGATGERRRIALIVLSVLAFLLVLIWILSMSVGAVQIPALGVMSIMAEAIGLPEVTGFSATEQAVILQIRLPRVLLGG